jgi:uncharacterized protein YihD (DUF1040 family)
MRDRKRINRILKTVKNIWEKNPELRLTQLLGNVFGYTDCYYTEDNELEKLLKEYYGLS